MHRFLPNALAILITLLAALPATAGGPSAREVERVAVELERLFQPLVGAVAEQDLVFTDHGGGIFSLSLSLGSNGDGRAGIDARAAADRPLKLLAAGHMAAEPTSPATSINAVVSDPESSYNIWWAAVNLGDQEETRRTTVKISGPEGFSLSVSDSVVYGPDAVHFFWFNPELPFSAGGIYAHRTSIKSAGKNLYKFWVE